MKNETVRPATKRQIREVIAAIIQAVPVDDLSFDNAQTIIGNKKDFIYAMMCAVNYWYHERREVPRAAAKQAEEETIPADGDPMWRVHSSGL